MKSYEVAIAEAKERYEAAMSDAAAEVLFLAHKYDRPLQTVCKDVAGDDWERLDARARRLKAKKQKQGKTFGPGGDAPWTQAPDKVRTAKNVLRDPEAAAQILADPVVREHVSRALVDTVLIAPDRPEHKTFVTPFDALLKSATGLAAALSHFEREGHRLTKQQADELRYEIAAIISKVSILLPDFDAGWAEVLDG